MPVYPWMAQPARIGRHTLENRVLMAPMGTNFSATNGVSTERDLLLRLADAGVVFHTETIVQSVGADTFALLRRGDVTRVPRDPHLLAATGPRWVTTIVATLDGLGLPHAVIGDANVPGDLLSGLRDACMVGHAI